MKRCYILMLLLASMVLVAESSEKMTCASYMGWYPPFSSSRGSVNPSDFSVIPLTLTPGEKSDSDAFYTKIHRQELQLMVEHGWNTIGVDGLFYDHAALADRRKPHHINRQLELMGLFEKAAAGLPDKSIKMVPFLEFLAAYKQMDRADAAKYFIVNMERMLKQFGSSPFWRQINGRPVILIYVANYFPIDFWQEVMAGVKKCGYNPYWVMELEGLDAALYGTYDHAELKPYLELFDGVYNFGCSALLEGATFPAKIRKTAVGLKADKYIGATLWPGYLSDRPYNRNLIAHDGTGFLRQVWELTKPANPDFLHWVFNDYKEATTLSLTFSTLSSRLEIAERFLAEYNNRPLPVAENGMPQSVISYRKALCSGEPLMLEFLPLPTQNGPKKSKIKICLLDEKNQELATVESPELSFEQMKDWRWNNAVKADRRRSRVIKVRVSLIFPDGKTITYANLPDIAVVPPRTKVDQLYYNIPLHRMVSSERSVVLRINGKAENAALHEGFRRIDWNVQGPGSDSAMIAIARSGHAFRRMAPQNIGGAEDVVPGQKNRNFQLYVKDKNAGNNMIVDWQPTDSPDGDEYYQVLALFPDGKWAYSPTIWTRLSYAESELWAQWIFVPDWQEKPLRIIDRSNGGFHLNLPETAGRWPFVALRGETKALEFKGDLVLEPSMESVPYGPMTLELVFSPARTDRRQYLVYQRGCQATLYLDEAGYLVAARLPENRKHPNPDVIVKSNEPLKADKLYDAVVVYDAATLKLYINGRLEGSAPCTGTRSSEGFTIGGIAGARDAMLKASGNANFHGKMLRLTILGRPWSDAEVKDVYGRLMRMPFWSN